MSIYIHICHYIFDFPKTKLCQQLRYNLIFVKPSFVTVIQTHLVNAVVLVVCVLHCCGALNAR